MDIEDVEKKTNDQKDAEFWIRGAIRRTRKKMILIIVGSFLVSCATYEGAHGGGISSFSANILYLIGALSFFLAIFLSIHIFTDFKQDSDNALGDWKKFVENEDEFWEAHKRITKIPWQ